MKIFGYRSKTPWKMGLATFVYGLILMIIVIAIIDPSSEEAIATLEEQQAAFNSWNTTFEETNTRFDEAWEITQNTIKGLSNGNINVVQAYSTLNFTKAQLEDIYKEYHDMTAPDQLTKEHQEVLKEVSDSMSTATFARINAIESLQQYLDNPKPSLLANSESMLLTGQEEMMSALTKVAQVSEELNGK